VPNAAVRAGIELPSDLLGFITTGRTAWNALAALPRVPAPDGWRLLAPIPRPRRNVFAVGRNYADHAAESGMDDLPDVPIVFSKAVDECGEPDGRIVADPALTTKLDWEAELAVVLGAGGRDIAEADALSHVFGYTVVNDISARDVQEERVGGQWFLGKSLAGACPMGPQLVSADALDPGDLEVSLAVNGVPKQGSSTRQLVFSVSRLIAEISRYVPLLAGDVIATGTPSGVGGARRPPEFVGPGDVMEATISGIGTLRTQVIGPDD
jgi:2-keto-4-pentenoate hydratase/2-oxohepta-3-ene-1,7-dioic acid hydratase in catechol pathway